MDVVKICEKLTGTVKKKKAIRESFSPKNTGLEDSYDVLVIGGTGFIGKGVVKQLVEEGKKVLVTARNIMRLPDIFKNGNVQVVSADITDKEKMDSLIKKVPIVIHLAHGGGGDTYDKIKESMIQGTVNIAESCIKHEVKHLSFISTIAALYLGENCEVIHGRTPVDDHPEERPVYSRGKAECEKILMKMHKDNKLPVSILRPGIVIGENGIPFHSGLGIFNQDKYCIGWNKGTNPLAFVLLEDTAKAICLDAFSEKTIGKAYNIVGDVRLTGREYIMELGKALNRKLYYLPQSVLKTQAIEIGKWFIKVFIQKRKVPFPSLRDLKSRGMPARFICGDLKEDLGWEPVKDRDEFIKKGILVYQN
jgi:nucleoside-diphosphate-sugar epimerase